MNTVEDLSAGDGAESCLDLIMEAADSVEPLELERENDADDSTGESCFVSVGQATSTPCAEIPEGSAAAGRLEAIDARRLPMTRRALEAYKRCHGGTDAEAEKALRSVLEDMRVGATVKDARGPGLFEVRKEDRYLVLSHDRFVHYGRLNALNDPGEAGRAPRPSTEPDGSPPTDVTGPSGSARAATQGPSQRSAANAAAPTVSAPLARPLSKTRLGQKMEAVHGSSAPSPVRTSDLLGELERLVGLWKAGYLTDEEFSAAKRRLLF
jgi:hypothetical protein